MGVYEKLSKVQAKLKAPKGQYNSFGKYNYRSCEDITEALKPLLEEEKAAVTMSDEVRAVTDRVYVTATATFIDAETGEPVSVTASAREPAAKKGMDESQITGMASSYARKYALNGLFAIDDTKDADSMQNTEPAQGKAVAEASLKQSLTRFARRNGWDMGRILADLGKKDMSQVTEEECRDYIRYLGTQGVNIYE